MEGFKFLRRFGLSVFILAFTTVLWLTQPFLLFHTVVEFISIFFAMSLFIIGTQSYKYSKDDELYLLSIAFFFISLFDGWHTLAYKGMNVIEMATTNFATQLWIAGRLLQIVAMCMFPFLYRFKTPKIFIALFFLALSVLMGVLITIGYFPTCYVDGVGITSFKKTVEYTIAALAVIAFVLIDKVIVFRSKRILGYVRFSLFFLAASELSFTVYTDVYAAMNALGHLFKIFSYLSMWIMVVEEGFAKPYDHMFRQIYDNSVHDQLTGLYNRRYYETVVTDDMKNSSPLSLVFADINGLKLMNDAFGHVEGDRVISCFTQVLQDECRSSDSIIRMGGDEFLILMPLTSLLEARAIVRNIVSGYGMHAIAGIPLSASFGCMENVTGGVNWETLLKRAEVEMYRQKLSTSMLVKSRIIDEVMQSIFKKSGCEERHSRNVASLSKAIAVKMNLPDAQVEEICKAGALHDIGKVRIERDVMNKESPLDESDVLEIQRHAEIGYTILSQVPEYSQLAFSVLHHHEHWDGRGYPLGISGEKIPLPARIIAVAETFDAMVSDRPYQTMKSPQKAIQEIREEIGKKFDRRVVVAFEEVIERGWHDSKPSQPNSSMEDQRTAGAES